MTRICVLKGGWSAEREVSLVSGAHCAAALREAGFEVREIDVTRDIGRLVADLDGTLGAPKPDVVFNALHGRYGEDGCVQGLLNLIGLPYTHSGVAASAIAMDKTRARDVFAAAGVTVADGDVTTAGDFGAAPLRTQPFVIKPTNEGSSVGVWIVTDDASLASARAAVAELPADQPMLLERYVPGHELTVAVVDDPGVDAESGPAHGPGEAVRALGVTELRPKAGFYDYASKYTSGETEHLLPAPVPDRVAALAMEWAKLVHRKLGCRGVTRSDFRFDSSAFDESDSMSESSALVMLEVNTQPGMTPLSLVPEQAAYSGLPFTALVSWLIERATCD